jgi:transposase
VSVTSPHTLVAPQTIRKRRKKAHGKLDLLIYSEAPVGFPWGGGFHSESIDEVRFAVGTKSNWERVGRGREVHLGRLESLIGPDDSVRVFDEIMSELDWSAWEAEYKQNGLGQPPIHPRWVASAILYGLYRGIRSSRRLEEACCYRFDFIWLVEGRRIDHTTFAKFRTKFHGSLKDLFRQIGRLALTMGMVALGEVAFDATRVKANNGRFKTRTAKSLEEKLAALDEIFEELTTQLAAADAEQESQGSLTRLPEELAKVEQRQQRVRQALEKVQAIDAARRKDSVNPEKNPGRVPMTDLDSRVMPNKEGGYAPNYTPMLITDGASGMILDCDVTAEVHEGPSLAAAVDRVQETFGRLPEKLLTDAGNNSGQVIEAMEQRGVEFYTPMTSNQPQAGNPAQRPDPTQSVPQEAWDQLPRNSQGQLDKSCFVYDTANDQYHCPQGHTLPFAKTKGGPRGDQTITLRVYRCSDCAGCPLAAACLSGKSKQGRTITRDPYEDVRERTAARMASESAQAIYRRRSWIAETPFALLKSVMGLRQFLLRGLQKVQTEWRWAATAFNIIKLVRAIVRMRAEQTPLLAGS